MGMDKEILLSKPVEFPIAYNNAMVEYTGKEPERHNNVNSLCSWLIDSGASCHVSGNWSLFSYIAPTQLKPIIRLPEAQHVTLNSLAPFNFLTI